MRIRNSAKRSGLSFVEFVGCMVSMVGGVVLGSVYLGIDVQSVAVSVLQQAQVISPAYFDYGTSRIAVESIANDAQQQPDYTDANSTLVKQDADVDARATEITEERNQQPPGPTPEERRTATRKYWNDLIACMLTEARGRTRSEGPPEEWQLFDYLRQRKLGHEEALANLTTLDPTGVDPRLIAHGEQVVEWHKSGLKLFEHAISMLSDGHRSHLAGPSGQSWQSAATQLRMEESLVLERHSALAKYLDREYPDLAPFKTAFAK